jgi:hypothetical protein
MSPEKYQPSRRTAAVACGSFQYPSMICGPRMMSSPGSPGAPHWSFKIDDAAFGERERLSDGGGAVHLRRSQ